MVCEDLTEAAMGHYLLVVNCTPLGTWPEIEVRGHTLGRREKCTCVWIWSTTLKKRPL